MLKYSYRSWEELVLKYSYLSSSYTHVNITLLGFVVIVYRGGMVNIK